MGNSRMLSHLVPSTDLQPASIVEGELKGFIPCFVLHQWGEVSVTTYGVVRINKGQS